MLPNPFNRFDAPQLPNVGSVDDTMTAAFECIDPCAIGATSHHIDGRARAG